MTMEMEMLRRERAARAEGMLQMALSLFKKGKLNEQEAAEEAGITVEAFAKALAAL